MTRGKKFVTLCLFVLLTIITYVNAYADMPIIACPNNTTPEQAMAFLKDRNASKEMIDCVPFIYDYCNEVGIDATIIIAISSIETGYGKSNLFINKNNPGGMKARKGWMKFDTLEDGYRAMINKIGAMAGARESNSFYYNTCYYVKDLGNIYWVENGCDRGYYKNLIVVMSKISSYEIKDKKDKKDKKTKTVIEEHIDNHNKTVKDNIIDIINKKRTGNGMSLLEKYR